MGAAQAIGWILTIDDTDLNSKLAGIQTNVGQIQNVLGETVSEAIKPAVGMLEEIRDIAAKITTGIEHILDPNTWKDIAKQVGVIKTDVQKASESVKEAVEKAEEVEILTPSWFDRVKDAVFSWGWVWKTIKFALVELIPTTIGVVVKGVQLILDIVFKISGIVFFVVGLIKSILGPIFAIVKFVTKTLFIVVSGIIKGATVLILKSISIVSRVAWGVLKTTVGLGLKAIGLFAKAFVNLGKVAVGVISTALSPIVWVVGFIREGIGKALQPIFSIVNDYLKAIMFLLEPFFMAFRIMLIPFIHRMMPLLVKMVIFVVNQIVEGWKWLWENGLEDVWKWMTSGKGVEGLWKNMKTGWAEFYEFGPKPIWNWMSSGKGVEGLWENMKKGWTGFMEMIDPIWQWMSSGKGIEGLWSNIQKGWNTFWVGEGGKGGLKAIWEWVKNPESWKQLWTDAKIEWDKLWKVIKEDTVSLVNWIRSKIGGILSRVGFSIVSAGVKIAPAPGSKSLIDLGSALQDSAFKLVKPIKFAEGGVITRPTLAVVGEGGPELVIPLVRAGAGGTTLEPAGATGGVTPLPAGFSVEKFMKTLGEIRDFLSRIVDNTEDSGWVNDEDFNAQSDRDVWEA